MTLDPRYDISRTGPPSWAHKDDGPMNTYVPGPLSSEPLKSSYHAGTRLVISGIFIVVMIGFVIAQGQAGALGTAAILVALWALYAIPVWLRGRTTLRVDGEHCTVQGVFRKVEFDGSDVSKVEYVFAGRSPDVRLVLRDQRKVTVVVSRLEKGHSTLYEWLRRYAPQAVYDKKALDLRDMLVNRGLMGTPEDPWDEADNFGDTGSAVLRTPEETVGATDQRLEESSPAPDSATTRNSDDVQA